MPNKVFPGTLESESLYEGIMTSDHHLLFMRRPSHWDGGFFGCVTFPLRRRLPRTTGPTIMLSIVMLSAWRV